MWWFIGGDAVIVGLVVGAAVWFLSPTLRTLRGPDFEPTPKDDESVFQAQQTPTPDAGT